MVNSPATSRDFDLSNRLIFSGSIDLKLKELSGWHASHRIPDAVNSSAELFIADICTADLEKDIDDTYQAIREHFLFKRRNLASSVSEDGTAAIDTPYFSYSVVAILNPKDPSELKWTRRINRIRNIDDLKDPAFAKVFDGKFDRVEIEFPQEVKVSDFIDLAEDAQIPGLSLDYDREFRYCNLRVSGSETEKINLTSYKISLVHTMPATVLSLLSSVETIYSLVSNRQLKLFSGLESERGSESNGAKKNSGLKT